MRPVGAELKFHGNSSHYTQHEIDAKYARSEARGLIVGFVVAPQRNRLPYDDERREAHGELWEEIVEGGREREVQLVNQKCAIHSGGLAVLLKGSIMPTQVPDGM